MMFTSCGHTICDFCLRGGSRDHKCPVCRLPVRSSCVPNYVLNKLLEEQFGEELKLREKELAQVIELQIKLGVYTRSSRYAKLCVLIKNVMRDRYIIHYQDLFKYLKTKVDDAIQIDDPLSASPLQVEEFNYLLAMRIKNRFMIPTLQTIGEYIITSLDVEPTIELLEKKSSSSDQSDVDLLRKMTPLLLFVSDRVSHQRSYETLERIALLHKIGKF